MKFTPVKSARRQIANAGYWIARKASASDRAIYGRSFYPIVPVPVKMIENMIAYKRVSTVSSCIDQIGDNLSQLPFEIYNRVTLGKSGKYEDVLITDDPRFDFIRRPNNRESFAQFTRKLNQYNSATGELFIEPVYNDFSSAFPSELYLHDPTRIEVNLGHRDYSGFTERINNQDQVFKPVQYLNRDSFQMLYVRKVDPFDDIRGLSPLDQVKTEVTLLYYALQFGMDFFKNSARFSGIFIFPEAIPDHKMEGYKEELADTHIGVNKRFKNLLLDNGVEYKETGVTQSDMLYLDQLKYYDLRICGRFGVPPALIGIFESQSHANVQDQLKFYWSETMKAAATEYQDIYNSFILPLFTNREKRERLFALYNFSDVEHLKKDFQKVRETAAKTFHAGGFTWGEYREEIGMERFGDERDDLVLLPNSVQKAELVMNEELYLPPVKDENEDSEETEDKNKDSEIEEDETKDVVEVEDEDGKQYQIVSVKAPARRNRELKKDIQQLEADFINKYRKIAKQQKEDVLSKLRKYDSVEKPDSKTLKYISKSTLNEDNIDDLFVDENKYARRIKKEFKTVYTRSAGMAAIRVGKELSKMTGDEVKIILYRESVNRVLKDRAKYLDKIPGNTNNMIETAVKKGIAKNSDIADISKSLQVLFDENISVFKANMIARTEAVASSNAADLEAFKESKIVEKRMWMSQRDEDVRDEHADMDGEVTKLNEAFSNGRMYPDEPNCRCWVQPMIKKSKMAKGLPDIYYEKFATAA